MNLWIRSQDGTILIKVDNLLIDDDNFHIYTHNHINNMQMTYTLGRYKTKERAIEVLDEIQNFIIKLSTLDMIGLPNENVAKVFKKVLDEENMTSLKPVYQMPKE